jgi:hypothetical protein
MADNLLDKLDRDPGGARKYVAALYSYGASHEQVAQKLAEKFGIRQPSKRITGEWRRNDAKLIALCDELEAIRVDMNPDASPADVLAAIPSPVDRGEAVIDFFVLLEQFPAFSALSVRCSNDPDFPDDVWLKVLREDHADDAAFETACAAAAGDYDPMTAAVEDHFAKHHERHSYADA